jgi:hypothetical protein
MSIWAKFSATITVLAHGSILTGATVMKTEIEGSAHGINDGNHAVGVPRFQFNLGAHRDVPGIAQRPYAATLSLPA